MEPPDSAMLTDYDRAHMKLYLRLLDAASDGASNTLDDSVDVDSTPEDYDDPSMRSNLRRARDAFENLLNGDSNK